MLGRLWQMQGCICMPQIAPQDKDMAQTNEGFRSRDRIKDCNDWAEEIFPGCVVIFQVCQSLIPEPLQHHTFGLFSFHNIPLVIFFFSEFGHFALPTHLLNQQILSQGPVYLCTCVPCSLSTVGAAIPTPPQSPGNQDLISHLLGKILTVSSQ